MKSEILTQEAYRIRIAISLDEKNHGDTLTWLKKLKESTRAAVDPETLKTEP